MLQLPSCYFLMNFPYQGTGVPKKENNEAKKTGAPGLPSCLCLPLRQRLRPEGQLPDSDWSDGSISICWMAITAWVRLRTPSLRNTAVMCALMVASETSRS